MSYRYVYQLVRALDDKISPDLRRIVEQYLGPDPADQRNMSRNLMRHVAILTKAEDGVWFHGIHIPWSRLEENIGRLFYVHLNGLPSRKCSGDYRCRNKIPVIRPRNILIIAYPYIDFHTMDAIYGIEAGPDGEVPHESYEPHGGWLGVALLDLRCDKCSEVYVDEDEDDPEEPEEFGEELAECDSYGLSLEDALEETQDRYTIVREPELAARLPALIEAERLREEAE